MELIVSRILCRWATVDAESGAWTIEQCEVRERLADLHAQIRHMPFSHHVNIVDEQLEPLNVAMALDARQSSSLTSHIH